MTTENKMFSGKSLFELKATHGLPLEVALDEIINNNGLVVDWVEFIETARQNKWWDFQTHDAILYSLQDATVPKQYIDEVMTRFKQYVVTHPHPLLKKK